LHADGDDGITMNMSKMNFDQYYRSGMMNKIKMLKSCIELLETDISLGEEVDVSTSSVSSSSPKTNKVFIVHGHNQGLKEAVARFIEKFDLEPIILHEKANEGRTIIEKFSDYSDVHFAVILLTHDDEGKEKGSTEETKPRARQNVILEMGFFLGKLGRARVCALYEEGVEIPSDYQGRIDDFFRDAVQSTSDGRNSRESHELFKTIERLNKTGKKCITVFCVDVSTDVLCAQEQRERIIIFKNIDN
ncbi:MAG: nucleotide-binding protein, partial [Bacteroidetes bacterium]|nr:nucleotide-binding protein [Bacteroidota bacterium]